MNNDYNPNNLGSSNVDYNATMSFDSAPQEPTNNFTENAAPIEQPTVGGNFCNNCGNKIQPGEKFCTKCGTNLVQAENLRCEQCGTPIMAGANFCNACGASVNKTQKMFCQFCGEKYEEGEIFCKNCGNKITKSEGFFGGFTSTTANGASHSSALPIQKMSSRVKTLNFIAIGLVVLMFIFSLLPAFTLKFKMDVDKDKLTKEERKQIEEILEEGNETLNDEFEMNIFHPYKTLNEDDETADGIEALQDSTDKKMSKLGDKLSLSATLSVVFAIVQAIAFVGMLALLILPLVKPVEIKILSILPIIFSACAIIYSVAIIFWTNGLFKDVIKILGLGDIGVGFEGINTYFSITGYIYLALAVALCVVTIITNVKKKSENA